MALLGWGHLEQGQTSKSEGEAKSIQILKIYFHTHPFPRIPFNCTTNNNPTALNYTVPFSSEHTNIPLFSSGFGAARRTRPTISPSFPYNVVCRFI